MGWREMRILASATGYTAVTTMSPLVGKWYSHDRVSRYPYSVPQHAATDCDCAFERKLGQLLTIVFILMEWLAACSLSRVSRHLRLFSGCMTEYHFD